MDMKDMMPWNWTKKVPTVLHDLEEPLRGLHTDLNRAFESFWNALPNPFPGHGGEGFPPVDVVDGEQQLEIRADLPGLDEGDLTVSITADVITLRGERKSEQQSTVGGVTMSERIVGTFERAIPLPTGLDTDAATATLKNGVLTITIPKADGAAGTATEIPVTKG